MTSYRRPKVYIPPYNYCDRWCERCRIDTSRCLLYQTEMDDRLHREIDGLGEPTAEEFQKKLKGDLDLAIRLVEEQAKGMGLDLEPAKAAAAPPAPDREPGPLMEEALAVARATGAFLRDHGKAFPAEAAVLRRLHILPGPKLGRAQAASADEVETADAILQAQTAHRALGLMLGAFEAAGRKRPGLLDPYLDLLALIQRLRREIEEAWFSLPCALLEPVEGETWWGPLRDITPTLKHLRR